MNIFPAIKSDIYISLFLYLSFESIEIVPLYETLWNEKVDAHFLVENSIIGEREMLTIVHIWREDRRKKDLGEASWIQGSCRALDRAWIVISPNRVYDSRRFRWLLKTVQ